jgi:hypothetical protein
MTFARAVIDLPHRRRTRGSGMIPQISDVIATAPPR